MKSTSKHKEINNNENLKQQFSSSIQTQQFNTTKSSTQTNTTVHSMKGNSIMPDFDINAMPQFDQQLQQINQQKTLQDEQSGSFDDRFVMFSTGNTYRFRLCWPVSPTGLRKGPFIFRNIHHDVGQGRSGKEITCPSSDYISGRAGFRMCSVCAETSKFYNDYTDHGNKTSKDLYDQFKRVQRNVALVYVVSDSKRPENNGHFMLIRVPKNVADYLRRKIFGWPVKKGEKELSEDQKVGRQAFLMDSGVDLVISVSTESTASGNFNSYQAEFLPKPTSVPVTQADVNRAGLELKFDEDFYKDWSKEETDQFLKECVLGLKMDYELNGGPSSRGSSGNTYNPSLDPNVGQQSVSQNPAVTTQIPNTTQVPSVGDTKQQTAPAVSTQPSTPAADGGLQPTQTNLDNILSDLGINQ